MEFTVFKGSPEEIGKQYGKRFSERIRNNIGILINERQKKPLPLDDPDFIKWVDFQEKIIDENWPWIIAEMEGVADGAGLRYRDILFLNLRVWHYAKPSQACCSSLAVSLADGTVANAGALDDPVELYCGLVQIVPANAHRFFSFPVTGTIWGNRGLNSAGLATGISSQTLPGLRKLPNAMNQDLALRVILQTCSRVEEVRDFCRQFPFTINLLSTDAHGGIFCAHQTSAGLFEIENRAPCALTNHITNDSLIYLLGKLGVESFPENPTTRLRRGKLLEFIREHNGKCSAEEVRKLIADRESGVMTSICPPHNVAVTYANPQAEPGKFWVADPQTSGTEKWSVFEL